MSIETRQTSNGEVAKEIIKESVSGRSKKKSKLDESFEIRRLIAAVVRTHSVPGLIYSRQYLRHDIPFSLIHDLAELAGDPSRRGKDFYSDRFLALKKNNEANWRIQVTPFGILDYFGISQAIRQIPKGVAKSSSGTSERVSYATRNILFSLLLLNEAAKTICYEPGTIELEDKLKRMTTVLVNYFFKYSPISACSGIRLSSEIVNSISYYPCVDDDDLKINEEAFSSYGSYFNFQDQALKAFRAITELSVEFSDLMARHTRIAKEAFADSYIKGGTASGPCTKHIATARLNRINDIAKLENMFSRSIDLFKRLIENDFTYIGFSAKPSKGHGESYEDKVIKTGNTFINELGGEMPLLYETVMHFAIKHNATPSLFKARCEYYYLRCFNFGTMTNKSPYNQALHIW